MLFTTSVAVIIIFFIARATFMIWKIRSGHTKYSTIKPTQLKTLICLGSGGHTSEMLKLVQTLNQNKYTPRYYVLAESDVNSENKLKKVENESQIKIIRIPRSRNVNQSYISSVFTTLYSILFCIPLMLKTRPELILCNGPGTCVPICLIGFLLKIFFISNCRVVFVESICRVKSFSLSGKILFNFADNIIVQWKELKLILPRADYLGKIM